MRFIHILRCPVEQINIDNHTSRRVARYQPARREAAEVSSPFISIFILTPMEKSQNALSNLVRVEISFMNYFEQMSLFGRPSR